MENQWKKSVALNELPETGSVSRKDIRKGRERLACVCMCGVRRDRERERESSVVPSVPPHVTFTV